MIKKEKRSTILTIVVPAYNVERYIQQCLNSLIGQTIDDFQVIIIMMVQQMVRRIYVTNMFQNQMDA